MGWPNNYAEYTYDTNGNVVGLVSAPLGTVSKNSIAVLGTSIEGLTSDSFGYLSRGAIPLANQILGCPFSSIGNFGVSSDTSGPSVTGSINAGMTSRVASIISGGYSWCYVGFPINDCTQAASYPAITLEWSKENMKYIYDTLLAAGINVIAVTGAPTFLLNSNSTGIYRNRYDELQKYIKDYATSKLGMFLVDTANALTDPATGIPFTSPATTLGDGIHDNYEGAMRKAQCIVDKIQSIVKPLPITITNNFSHRNYVTNPMGLGSNATGVNGASLTTLTGNFVPNGWRVSSRNTGAGVVSKVSRASLFKQPSQGTRIAFTATSNYDGAIIRIGGDDIIGNTGRYDQNWAATTAYTYGDRKKPSVSNGFHYVVITPGTSGGSEPTWTTNEGDFIVDNTVTWMCQKTPTTGDQFYAEVEVETSGLTVGKGGAINLRVRTIDNTGSAQESAYANFYDLSGSLGVPARYLPPIMILRTPIITIGNHTIRYLLADISMYGEAGASFNVDIYRAAIVRV